MSKLTIFVNVSRFYDTIMELQKLQLGKSVPPIPENIALQAAQVEMAIRKLWSSMDRADLEDEVAIKQGEIDESTKKLEERTDDQLVTSEDPYKPPKIPETDEILRPPGVVEDVPLNEVPPEVSPNPGDEVK